MNFFAKQKIKRIFKSDKVLADKIINSELTLLDVFNNEKFPVTYLIKYVTFRDAKIYDLIDIYFFDSIFREKNICEKFKSDVLTGIDYNENAESIMNHIYDGIANIFTDGETKGNYSFINKDGFKKRHPELIYEEGNYQFETYTAKKNYYNKELRSVDIIKSLDILVGKKIRHALATETSSYPKHDFSEYLDQLSDEDIQLFLTEIKEYNDVFSKIMGGRFTSDLAVEYKFFERMVEFKNAETSEEKKKVIGSIANEHGALRNSWRHRDLSYEDIEELGQYFDVKSLISEDLFEFFDKYSIEQLKSLTSNPSLLTDDLFYVVGKYGMDIILKYNKEWDNFFVNNAKQLRDDYFHYAGNVHNPDKNILTNREYFDRESTKEELFESIRRMIYFGPTNFKTGQVLNYRNLGGEFREKNSNLFITEDASEEFKKLFYDKKLTASIIKSYPNYKDYLNEMDAILIFNEIGIETRRDNYYNNYEGLISHLKRNFGNEEAINIMLDYSEYLYKIGKVSRTEIVLDHSNTTEKLYEAFDIIIYDAISKSLINYNENLPKRFKDKHAFLFLPDNAPKDIKDKFYNKQFTINDFINDPSLLNYFKQTDLGFGLVKDYIWINSLLIKNNEKKIKILSVYDKINDYALKDIFRNYITSNINEIEDSKFEFVGDLLFNLSYSNSSEISRMKSELANQLLKSDNPLDNLAKIENIFLKNNIPVVGKIYSVFKILNPNFNNFNFSKNSKISPMLKSANDRNREIILFSDLIKSSFGSNNRSIKSYINNLEKGNQIFCEIASNTISYEELNEDDKKELTTFMLHLKTLYHNTKKGKDKNGINFTNDTVNDLNILVELFSQNGNLDYELPDRIVKMFCYFAGFSTLKQVKDYITIKTDNADKRNRLLSHDGLQLKQGDFVKGINDVRYLSSILQNGSVSKEFLGSSSASDLTPLDTDLSIVTSGSNTDEMINSTEAKGYGSIWLILKNDDRFTITRDKSGVETNSLDGRLNKIEAFYTGAVGESHYGIRTGFASSEIDCIVTSEYTPKIGLEIALNGFYIPVFDKATNKLVFSENDYENIRFKMTGLGHFGLEDYQFASELSVKQFDYQIIEANSKKTVAKRKMINAVIAKSLSAVGLNLKTTIDGNLSDASAELIDTGSTGRNTNMPNDGDFDFMLRLDKKIMMNSSKLCEVKKALLSSLSEGSAIDVTNSGDFRLKGIKIDGLDEPVDLDITFVEKTDKLTYSTEMALQDRLDNIKKTSVENYYVVIDNILTAKKFLKYMEIYKPNRGDTAQGGLGGVGIENWILQNGGSFDKASKEFLAYSEGKTFEEFKNKYQVWDFGENHMASRKDIYPHDNFIFNNMSKEGYEKMKMVLSEYIKNNNVVHTNNQK